MLSTIEIIKAHRLVRRHVGEKHVYAISFVQASKLAVKTTK